MNKRIFVAASIGALLLIFSISSCKKNDTTPPVITVSGGNEQTQPLPTVAGTATFAFPAVSAIDDVDGDISANITQSGTVNPNVKGDYTIRYAVNDATGNSTVQNVIIHIVNDAEWITGAYTVTDSVYNTSPLLPGLPFVSAYTGNPNEMITSDETVNNKIWVTKFGNYTGGSIPLMVSGTGSGATLDIPQDTVLCGNPSATRVFSDDTQIPAATVFMYGSQPGFLLYYKEVVPANSSSANATGRYLHN